nr:FtsZ [Porphyromonas gingivalis]
MEDELLNFNYTDSGLPVIIKVIGVGGGGGNAVKNMYHGKVRDVSFLLCNTDLQALDRSEVPDRLVLGREVTNGLGAGSRPEVARRAAEASEADIRKILDDGHTRMVFVTAGMGGGTGTGAAPVIGRIARELNILTVGIVTIPFVFEGKRKILQALEGVEEMRKNVDALLVVNNERLRIIYKDLKLDNAFAKADETLTNAANGIAEMIMKEGTINLDFADVHTTLKDGGIAIISTGYGEGPDRMEQAINEALTSPLLNNNDIFKARRVLFNIYQGTEDPLGTDELSAINELTAKIETGFDTIWGYTTDPELGKKVKITILASGFDLDTTRESIRIGDNLGNVINDPISSREIETQNERDNDLINRYYRPDELEKVKVVDFKPIILNLDELDNDELIMALEEKPAYSRTGVLLSRIDNIRMRIAESAGRLKKDVVRSEESERPAFESERPSSPTTISFN